MELKKDTDNSAETCVMSIISRNAQDLVFRGRELCRAHYSTVLMFNVWLFVKTMQSRFA